MGFDDTFQSRIVWPQLTTVRQPLQELGRTGVSLLMRLLEGQRVEALRMELSTTLVVRGSTAPPRDAAAYVALAALVVACASAALVVAARSTPRTDTFVVHRLVADTPGRAAHVDPQLVNPWGLAATPTGEWWTGNEARESSTLYSGTGRKTVLDVHVDGGPTAVVFNSGRGFVERGGGRSDPARFIYACEDGIVARVDADCTDRLVDARRTGVQRRAGGALPRSRAARLAALRHGLPQRHASSSSTRGGTGCARSRRVHRSGDPGVVCAVRYRGDRRPCLRHVRVARARERQRRADRRLRRRVHARTAGSSRACLARS